MNSPGEVLGDIYAEELDAADHHQLLGLTNVQREFVVVTPVSQGVHLFSVG